MAGLIEMTVDSVRLHAPTRQHVIVLKESDGRRYLPVWSSVVEANSISLTLKGRTFERPLTHDLLANVLDAAHVTVERVLIVAPGPAAHVAVIDARDDHRTLRIDARPADAIALALRTGAPICVEPKVLEEDAIMRPDGSSPGDDKLSALRDIVNSMDLPALESEDQPPALGS